MFYKRWKFGWSIMSPFNGMCAVRLGLLIGWDSSRPRFRKAPGSSGR